jgi:hypothetical protein
MTRTSSSLARRDRLRRSIVSMCRLPVRPSVDIDGMNCQVSQVSSSLARRTRFGKTIMISMCRLSVRPVDRCLHDLHYEKSESRFPMRLNLCELIPEPGEVLASSHLVVSWDVVGLDGQRDCLGDHCVVAHSADDFIERVVDGSALKLCDLIPEPGEVLVLSHLVVLQDVVRLVGQRDCLGVKGVAHSADDFQRVVDGSSTELCELKPEPGEVLALSHLVVPREVVGLEGQRVCLGVHCVVADSAAGAARGDQVLPSHLEAVQVREVVVSDAEVRGPSHLLGVHQEAKRPDAVVSLCADVAAVGVIPELAVKRDLDPSAGSLEVQVGPYVSDQSLNALANEAAYFGCIVSRGEVVSQADLPEIAPDDAPCVISACLDAEFACSLESRTSGTTNSEGSRISGTTNSSRIAVSPDSDVSIVAHGVHVVVPCSIFLENVESRTSGTTNSEWSRISDTTNSERSRIAVSLVPDVGASAIAHGNGAHESRVSGTTKSVESRISTNSEGSRSSGTTNSERSRIAFSPDPGRLEVAPGSYSSPNEVHPAVSNEGEVLICPFAAGPVADEGYRNRDVSDRERAIDCGCYRCKFFVSLSSGVMGATANRDLGCGSLNANGLVCDICMKLSESVPESGFEVFLSQGMVSMIADALASTAPEYMSMSRGTACRRERGFLGERYILSIAGTILKCFDAAWRMHVA